MVPPGYSKILVHKDSVCIVIFSNGHKLDVKSVSINRLIKYGVYTNGQVYGYTLTTNSDISYPKRN